MLDVAGITHTMPNLQQLQHGVPPQPPAPQQVISTPTGSHPPVLADTAATLSTQVTTSQDAHPGSDTGATAAPAAPAFGAAIGMDGSAGARQAHGAGRQPSSAGEELPKAAGPSGAAGCMVPHTAAEQAAMVNQPTTGTATPAAAMASTSKVASKSACDSLVML